MNAIEKKFKAVYYAMVTRCNNENSPLYKFNGGQGIKICKRWSSFEMFKEDMYEEYKKLMNEGFKVTLTRKDSTKDYKPHNCYWKANSKQVMKNEEGKHKNNIRALREGCGYNQVQFAERIEVNQGYISEVERGLKMPNIELLFRIATVLNVSIEDLFKIGEE